VIFIIMHAYNITFSVETLLKFEYFIFILQNPYIYHRREKTKEREDKIHEALEFLENVLKKSTWTAGDSMLWPISLWSLPFRPFRYFLNEFFFTHYFYNLNTCLTHIFIFSSGCRCEFGEV